MNAFALVLQAAIVVVSGVAVPAAESAAASSGCAMPLPLGGGINIAHLPFSISLPLPNQNKKREVELGNEEYMLSWWSSQDELNGELFTEMSHSLASSIQPLVVAPQPPPVSPHTCTGTSPANAADSSPINAAEPSSIDAAEPSSINAAEPSSLGYAESRPLSIIEESGSPSSVQPAEVSAPSLLVSPANSPSNDNAPLCRTGMMRCTDDGGQFDTCLYGKWGTVRTCARGTRCVAIADDAIACAF
ncbi:hypothetical protein IWW36_003998 [Coemansia brasiliensis]|uniref:Uncharacterized protein n=1 Tax=Coemansia brasiliensis TaxID=2650707 RepID=A0A9W8LWP1_9FUNG|nr:hypothetical protein IWW36_003998 [Coemansia brasiliensis]